MFNHLNASGRAELAAVAAAHQALADIQRESGDISGQWIIESLAARMFELMRDPKTGTILLTPEWIEENSEPAEPIVGEPATWEDPMVDPWVGVSDGTE